MELKEKCLIIDGNNLLHSSYHVSLKLPWKMKKGTMFFFLRVMISILKKGSYQRLLVVFDGGGTNFRELIFSHYKNQRVSMPEELWEQMKELKLLLEKVNITYIQLVDCEADDLIATFINVLKKSFTNTEFHIFTRDKDLLQLINENINILKYINSKITLYTYQNFLQEYSFSPQNYVDYLSLIGDSADNIPGVKGIGPVSAKKLIKQFQNVENIYQKIAYLSENTKKLLENKRDLVFTNKKIIGLATNISLPSKLYEKCEFNWEKWKNSNELWGFCRENGFNSILKLLN